ncbi:MAG: protein kinase [Candidatus Eiseniibacteriota bacterium]|nr:MAG: protein kinase [Candidatus Eisenbacteria bacterium]
MIGKTISHFNILENLGEGGMGVVYKALDAKLKRTVALKFLTPQALGSEDERIRFIHEAQAAAALNHPNICTIYEIDEADGQTFISMECVEGQSLKERISSGPLTLDEAITIATQVAEGLQKAHEKDIVHRDIKSANIMITSDGQTKIMDFGLAKLAGVTKVTKTGTTMGTIAYMSPQQARGEPVDHRTDIWSLGVVLHEMLTGRLPFRGDHDAAVFYSITNSDPEPLTNLRSDIPLEFERIVEKALAKDPEKRYERVEELIDELRALRERLDVLPKRGRLQLHLIRHRRRIAMIAGAAVVVALLILVGIHFFPGGVEPVDSIAVLPLENLSGDPEQEYFADGMTEALITELSKIGAVRIISRTSVMRYRDTDKPLAEIARELGVDAVVEGSVLRVGERVRITAQLIGAVPERHLWADNYDRDLTDVLILSSEVAQAIAQEIRIALTPQEQAQLAGVISIDPEAYDLYLKGMHHYEKWTTEGWKKAIEYFQKVIEVEPNYARAYDGLADCYLWLAYSGVLSQEEAVSKANPFLRRALEIDETLAEAHETLGGIKHYFDWDFLGAEAGYRRAIEFNPSLVEARIELAVLLSDMTRFEEAEAEAKRALRLDPLSLPANRTMGYVYLWAHRYDEAIAHYRQMAELYPDMSTVHRGLARSYAHMGKFDEAVRTRQEAAVLSGDTPERVEALAIAYNELGPRGYWLWCLETYEGLQDRYPAVTSMYYAKLGETDKALALLEKAYEKHDMEMHTLKSNPYWDPLRDDPRFQDLLRRMNFPEN